jgi:DNA-binding response OmpR family regulator
MGRRVRILVAEDARSLADRVAEGLRDQGMAVDIARDGLEAAAKLDVNAYDVVVLDRDLPGIHGDTLCQMITSGDQRAMVLMLTAAGSPQDRVSGLVLGADDYLAKPFGMAEFMARVQALARRAGIAPPSEREQALEFPGLRIDPAQHRAFLLNSQGVATDARLTRTEFRLLHQLARNAGRVLSRDELHQRVWDVPYRHRDRTVDVFVRKLREKLDRRSSFAYVHTHYGVGHRFGAEVRGSDAA